MSNSSVDPRIVNPRYKVELCTTSVSISSKNRMAISTLFMKFDLYGLVMAWIKVAHTKTAACSADVCEGKRVWFRNKNSISILRMRNDAEAILKSRVPLVPSLYCPWNDSTNMCRACHLRNPQHAIHLLNSFVGYRMRRIVGKNVNITATERAIAWKMVDSCVFHSTVES